MHEMNGWPIPVRGLEQTAQAKPAQK